jgi:hypothetical protein
MPDHQFQVLSTDARPYTVWPMVIRFVETITNVGHTNKDDRTYKLKGEHSIAMIYKREANSLTLIDADDSNQHAQIISELIQSRMFNPPIGIIRTPGLAGKFPLVATQTRSSDRACGAWSILAALYFMNKPEAWPLDSTKSYQVLESFMTRFGSVQTSMLEYAFYHKDGSLFIKLLHYLATENVEFNFPWDNHVSK